MMTPFVTLSPQRVGELYWFGSMSVDGTISPAGYCADCVGHPTPEAAAEHFRKWMLFHQLTFGQWEGITQRCCECGEDSDGFAQVGRQYFVTLCDQHRKKEVVEKLYRAQMQVIL